jgi:DNA-binding GntR family transcriptional regulator
MKHCLAALLASVLALSAVSASAQEKTQRIRGTITAFDGTMLSVKSRDGSDLVIELNEKASVAAAKAITLADLKQGTYVGATTMKRADGALVALEVHTLPPAVAPGHRPWDLEPSSMMTNANIESVVQSAGGQELTLVYKDGSQKILVPPGTPIVTTTAADRTFLKPGEYVFLTANVGADGKLTTAARIQVSHGGVKPPQ